MRFKFAVMAFLGLALTACPTGDSTAPVVAISAPINSTRTGNISATITGTASDNVAVGKLEYVIGTAATVDVTASLVNGNYSFPVTLALGSNTIKVIATDAAANSANAEVTVILDSTLPSVVITAPTTGFRTLSSSSQISGTASDNGSITKLEYSIGAGAAVDITANLVSGNYSFNAPLAVGPNVVQVKATDDVGNSSTATVNVQRLAGTATIKGTLTDEQVGAAVAGSTIQLFDSVGLLGSATSSSTGTFEFANIPMGVYTLKARKAKMAGSDVVGLVANTGTTDIPMIQRPAFDPNASTTPITLELTDTQVIPQALNGQTFTDTIPFRMKLAANSDHNGILDIMYLQLGRTPGSGYISNNTTTGRFLWSGTNGSDSGNQSLSGNSVAGYGLATGEAVSLHAVAYDSNHNRVHRIIPITFISTNSRLNNTLVTAPTGVAAFAVTLQQNSPWTALYGAGNVTNKNSIVNAPQTNVTSINDGAGNTVDIDPNAAASGSNMYVEVRWCYTGAVLPFAFDVMRSNDAGATYTLAGTVGGITAANSAGCATGSQFSRNNFFRDNSPDLMVGTEYTYKVVARAANTVDSAVSTTTPLAPFTSPLRGPANEATNVSLTPTYQIDNSGQLGIGADGVLYQILYYDLLSGNGRRISNIDVRQGTGGNAVPVGQNLVLIGNSVATDTANVSGLGVLNLIPITSNVIQLPQAVFGVAALQSIRTYEWQLEQSVAYKLQGTRVSAYSAYVVPSTTAVPGIGLARQVAEVFRFTTGR